MQCHTCQSSYNKSWCILDQQLVVPHLPYSSDLTRLGYHLFRSLRNHLNNENLSSLKDWKNGVERFFFSEDQAILRRWNNEATAKVAKSHRKEWRIHRLKTIHVKGKARPSI